jgi:hypothetical protein
MSEFSYTTLIYQKALLKIQNIFYCNYSCPNYFGPTFAVNEMIYRIYTNTAGTATVQGSKPGGNEIFRVLPDRPWGPISFLYNGYRFSLSGVKRSRSGNDHPPHKVPRVKKE